MQSIQTKFVGPTNSHGTRVRAKCDAGSITVVWDDALGEKQNHALAAMALVRQLGWTYEAGYHGNWLAGSINVMDYVFVYSQSDAYADTYGKV